MNDPGVVFNGIVETCSVLDKVIIQITEIIAVNHPIVTSDEPNIAFAQIFSTSNVIEKLKQVTDGCSNDVPLQIFTSNTRDRVHSSIDVSSINTTLLLGILLKIPEMLGVERTRGQCSCETHKDLAQEEHKGGDQQTPSQKCSENEPSTSSSITTCTDSSNEQTTTSDKTSSISEDTQLCCSQCNVCLICNKVLSDSKLYLSEEDMPEEKFYSDEEEDDDDDEEEDEEEEELDKQEEEQPQLLLQPCPFFLFQYCLEISQRTRDLLKHGTIPKIRKLIAFRMPLVGFPMCTGPRELCSYIKSTFNVLIDYIGDTSRFPKKALPLEDHTRFLEKIEGIWKFGESYFTREQMTIASKERSIIITAMKDLGEPPSSFSMQFLISRNDLPGHCPMFHDEDMDMDKEIRGIFYNSVIDAIEQVCDLKLGVHYTARGMDSNYIKVEKEEYDQVSNLKFKMVMKEDENKPFPEKIGYEMTEEAKVLRIGLKENIEREIISRYGKPVRIGFTRWSSGSLIIEGGVHVFHGEFNDTEVEEILEIIKVQGQKYCHDVTINQIIPRRVDFSKIEFSFKVQPLTHESGMCIRDEILYIKNAFMKKLKIRLAQSKDWMHE